MPPGDVTPCTGAGPRLDLTPPPRGQRLLESSYSSQVSRVSESTGLSGCLWTWSAVGRRSQSPVDGQKGEERERELGWGCNRRDGIGGGLLAQLTHLFLH